MSATHCFTSWPLKVDISVFRDYVRGFTAYQCAEALAEELADNSLRHTTCSGGDDHQQQQQAPPPPSLREVIAHAKKVKRQQERQQQQRLQQQQQQFLQRGGGGSSSSAPASASSSPLRDASSSSPFRGGGSPGFVSVTSNFNCTSGGKKQQSISAAILGSLVQSSSECRRYLLEEVQEQFVAFRQLEARDEFLNDPRAFLTANVDGISESDRNKILNEYYTLCPSFYRASFGIKLPATIAQMRESVGKTRSPTASEAAAAAALTAGFVQRQTQNLNRIAGLVATGYGKSGTFSKQFSVVDAIAENFQLPSLLAWQYAALVFAAQHKLREMVTILLLPFDVAQSVTHLLMTVLCTESKLFPDEKLQADLVDVARLFGDSRVAAELARLAAAQAGSSGVGAAATASSVSTSVSPNLAVPATANASANAAAHSPIFPNPQLNNNNNGATPVTPATATSGGLARRGSVAGMPVFPSSASISSIGNGGAGSNVLIQQNASNNSFAIATPVVPSVHHHHHHHHQHHHPASVSTAVVHMHQLCDRLLKGIARACYLFSGGGLPTIQLVNKSVVLGFAVELEKLFLASFESTGVHAHHHAHHHLHHQQQQHQHELTNASGASPTVASSPQQHQQQPSNAAGASPSPATVNIQQQLTRETVLAPAAALQDTKRALTALKRALNSMSPQSVASLTVGLVGGVASFGNPRTLEAANKVLDAAVVMCALLQSSLWM